MSESFFRCKASCGHELIWGESPRTPSASLPHLGQAVYCPECGSVVTISALEPRAIIVFSNLDVGIETGYDAVEGGWFYELRGDKRFSSDAIYASEEEAYEAAKKTVEQA